MVTGLLHHSLLSRALESEAFMKAVGLSPQVYHRSRVSRARI